jgi:secondary thiamine-phosphate synthase enzyme
LAKNSINEQEKQMTSYKTFTVRTSRHTQMIDITGQVEEIVESSGVESGVCTIFTPHTTAAITINENADPNVVRDFTREIDKIVPWEDDYLHAEGNSAAHFKSSMIGCSEQVIVDAGRLVLGTWQGIYFVEFDGPRTRKVHVAIL